MQLTFKTRMKFLKAQFIEFLCKKRYMGNHPKTKKMITVMFLLTVNSFIVWNVSMSMPEVKISVSDGHFEYENKALASTVKTEVKEEVKKEEKDLADYIWMKESSRGKNNFSKCEEIGKINGVGYAIPGDGSYICFDSHEEEMKAVDGWLAVRKASGWSELKMLCTYSGNHYDECKK